MRMREAESAARRKGPRKYNKRKRETLGPPQQISMQQSSTPRSSAPQSSAPPSSAPLPTAVGAREQPTRRKRRPRNVVAETVGCSKLEASDMLRVCKGNIDEAITMLRVQIASK